MDNKDEGSTSAMIALLPTTTDWCHIRLPHLTLVYAGEIEESRSADFNELGKDAAALAQMQRPMSLRKTGLDVFGGRNYDTLVDVIRLEATTELLAMRRFVEKWNESEYPFNPHVTVGPQGSADPSMVPPYIGFNRIFVGWGNESLTFWMAH